MASLETRVEAVLLPAGFRRRTCGRLCVGLRPAPIGSLFVAWVSADGTFGVEPRPLEVGVFGALRESHRWLFALVTADETWFHGEYTDARVLRQFGGEPPASLRCILAAELIVLT